MKIYTYILETDIKIDDSRVLLYNKYNFHNIQLFMVVTLCLYLSDMSVSNLGNLRLTLIVWCSSYTSDWSKSSFFTLQTIIWNHLQSLFSQTLNISTDVTHDDALYTHNHHHDEKNVINRPSPATFIIWIDVKKRISGC